MEACAVRPGLSVGWVFPREVDIPREVGVPREVDIG